ncbi:MAG: response regulator [Planctomycetota bacterium]|jgi:two-component system alkaline phosphatase synthesis response regulator PhoP
MSKSQSELDDATQPAALPLAGRKLVVADDEPDQLEYLATVFEDYGATVVRAANGDEVLALVRSEQPDLLTLDLAMPGRDVGEVYEILRKDPELERLKICVITGRPELRGLIYQRSVMKPDGYLNKPVTPETLLRAVRKCLELSH